MKRIIFLFLFSFLPLFGGEKGFGYGSLGLLGGYPTVGGGYRMHHGYHGFDISGKAFPWITLPAMEAHALYLLYPKQKGFYVGAGLGFACEAETCRRGSLTGNAALGYQWKTMRGRNLFLQAEGIVPFRQTGRAPIWPALTFGVGF